MRAHGLRLYRQRQSALTAARNVADMRRLDGPGAAARLAAIQKRFRRLDTTRGGPTRPAGLVFACALVFATVLGVGFLLL